jgi:hypothetical protein
MWKLKKISFHITKFKDQLNVTFIVLFAEIV